MEFTVEVLDYGRHGVLVKEPRTRLVGEGGTKQEALDDIRRKLEERMTYDYIPPADGPARSIETITV